MVRRRREVGHEERDERERRTIRLPSSMSILLPMTTKGKFSGSLGEACQVVERCQCKWGERGAVRRVGGSRAEGEVDMRSAAMPAARAREGTSIHLD